MSDFQKTLCKITGDVCYKTKLENGLTLYIAPNETTTYHAVFYTNFGSADSVFEKDGKIVKIPDGMAHFLEHKLFETEDGGDAFELFAKTGADANAYTSFTKTCYVFSCTDEFYRSLDILLSFVTSPHFTKESVEKEKGIIIEEITMYDDAPDWQCMFGMMKGLYRKDNPLTVDIAGDATSVSEATDEMLYSIYESFYSLSNMTLCISGNVDKEKILKMCQSLKDTGRTVPKTVYPDENKASCEKLVEKKMQVSRSLFSFGIKDLPVSDDYERQKKICAVAVFSNMLFGPSSEIYSSLYDKMIINKTFFAEYESCSSYAFFSFRGETQHARKAYEALCEYIEEVKQKGFDDEEFETSRRVVYAGAVRDLENSIRVCEDMSDIGELLFLIPEITAELTKEYAFDVFCELFTPESYTLSIIDPINNDEREKENVSG